MKTNISILAVLALLLSFTSCTTEVEIQPISTDHFLEGQWQIDSIQVSPTSPVDYFGTEVSNDTTFTDVGMINIQDFNAFNLGLNSDNPEIINAPLSINDKTFNFTIDKLFKSDDQLFAYLRLADATLLDSDEGKFVESLTLFNRNSYVDVLDDNTIVFRQASGGDAGRIFLSRM